MRGVNATIDRHASTHGVEYDCGPFRIHVRHKECRICIYEVPNVQESECTGHRTTNNLCRRTFPREKKCARGNPQNRTTHRQVSRHSRARKWSTSDDAFLDRRHARFEQDISRLGLSGPRRRAKRREGDPCRCAPR